MQFLTIALSAVILLWLAYLLRRSFMPRIPGQIDIYRRIPPAGIVAVSLADALLLGFGAAAALEEAWVVTAWILSLAALYAWLITRPGLLLAAYSEEGLTVRGLVGPSKTYRWADISAYTARTELTGGRHRFPVKIYRLTLPDQVVDINGSTDAGVRVLQVLERQRKDLKAIRQPERTGT